MEKALGLVDQMYRHPLIHYCVIGGGTFMLDFFLLVFLHGHLGINLLVATTLAYWTSIAFNFVTNRFWTFGATDTHVIKHLVPYLALLGFNYLFTLAFVGITTYFGLHYTIAKIIAVIIQISWTYVIYKKVIFR